jgi:hypothetical protein
MELLITAVIIGLVIWGLERNRVRQATQAHTYLAGSSDVVDRDEERLSGELVVRGGAVLHS